jgi:hypothetical protein
VISRSPYVLGGFPPLLLVLHPPGFYGVAMAALGIMLGLVVLGHAVLGLLRDLRSFLSGR